MPELYRAGSINQNVFSFFLTGLEGSSYMDFGKPNPNAMSNEDDLVWIQSRNINNMWTNYINGFRWRGDGIDRDEYYLANTFALTDTGSSCILGPSDTINYIVSNVENLVGDTYQDSRWGMLFWCDKRDNLPDFELLFGGYWMQVR